MHICIPDTREVKPQQGGAYLLYNVHIDGLYHCSLRFKQLLHLHQALLRKFTTSGSSSYRHRLPPFPSKKLLPLSSGQVEERRTQLEKYLQNISQDKAISNSSIFNLFLLEAQRESTRIRDSQVHLDIELVNGQKIRLQIVTHDSADAILTSVCRALGLNDRYHAYFCLCLCGYDVVRDKLIIKRRLSFFEAPFITLQMALQQQEQLQNVLSTSSSYNLNYSSSENNNNNGNNNCHCLSCSTQQQQQLQSNSTGVPQIGSSSGGASSIGRHFNHHHHNHHHSHSHSNGNGGYYLQSLASSSSSTSTAASRPFVTHRILLRKSYWDPIYDTYLLNDQQALNLLFIQTVYDIKHSLMFVDRETYHQLESLLASDLKLDYILLARTLKYYNYVHFEPCYSDYPRPRTKVMISIGSKELNMRVLKPTRIKQQQQQHSSSTSSSPSNGFDGNEERKAVLSDGSMNEEPILYCTSSLVPSGYQHLITKDDIIEEEYNFKVPLIRCWRLTSLETLNCANTDCNNNNNSTSGRISSAATTALAGGKRRSLSLFNSVVGNSSNTNNNQQSQQQPQQQSISGTDGVSLLTALSGNSFFRCGGSSNYNGTTTTGNNVPNQNNQNHHLYCQHENQKCEQPMRQQQQPADLTQFCQYELSFEYLVSKDTLKWITISSDQAIFISISLQGVVDELVSKRDIIDCSPLLTDKAITTTDDTMPSLQNGSSSSPYNHHHQQQQTQLIPPLTSSASSSSSLVASPHPPPRQRSSNNNSSNFSEIVSRRPATKAEKFTYLSRDGLQKQLSTSNQQLIDKFGTTLGYSPISPQTLAATRRHRQQQQTTSRNSSALSFIGVAANSSSAASRMFAPVAGSFWNPSETMTRTNNGLAQQQLLIGNDHHQQSMMINGGGQITACSFEISHLKKAPSPIINDAFEGVVTNDDDL